MSFSRKFEWLRVWRNTAYYYGYVIFLPPLLDKVESLGRTPTEWRALPLIHAFEIRHLSQAGRDLQGKVAQTKRALSIEGRFSAPGSVALAILNASSRISASETVSTAVVPSSCIPDLGLR